VDDEIGSTCRASTICRRAQSILADGRRFLAAHGKVIWNFFFLFLLFGPNDLCFLALDSLAVKMQYAVMTITAGPK